MSDDPIQATRAMQTRGSEHYWQSDIDKTYLPSPLYVFADDWQSDSD